MSDKRIKKIKFEDNIKKLDLKSNKSLFKSQLDINSNKINIRNSNQKEISKSSRFPSKRKLNIVINLDTVAYNIVGLIESKNRNYDKITEEIKKLESKNEIEKSKLQKQIDQLNRRINDKSITKSIRKENSEEKENILFENKVNLQKKKLRILELERDKKLNYIEVIQKLKIPPEERKIRDILRIKTYIEQSNLGKNFKEEFSDMNTIEKLIYFCSIEMRYEKYSKGEIIYKIGDLPNSFYSIIFGKIGVQKPIEKTEILTGLQYFKYLMKLKKEKEHFIFNLCIKNNKINFKIEQNDGDKIHYIFLIKYLDYISDIKEDEKLEFDKILDLLDINPEELGINPSKINSYEYINSNIKLIKKRIPNIAEALINKYSFINNYLIKKEVLIYEFKTIKILKGNDYFGNDDIENRSTRNETIIAEEDSEIAYLPNKLYSTQIATIKAIELENKISNLHSSFFFIKIKYSKFSKKYYNYFIRENYNKGKILFNEDEKIQYLYFLKEGNVQLYTSKSMNEMQQLINLLLEKKAESENKQIDNYNSFIHLNSVNNELIKYLNQKQYNKLLILNNNEDIGIVSYFLGENYLTSCIIVSNFAQIYKISIHDIDTILNNENEYKDEYLRRIKKKLELLSERLFKIKNIKLFMTDEKINLDTLEKYNMEEKNKILTKVSNNKALINYDKINDFLSFNTNYNSSITKNHSKSNNLSLPKLNLLKTRNLKNSFFKNDELNTTSFSKKNINKKKELIFEDNLIKRIHKEIQYFTENKYTVSKENFKLRNNRNNSIKDYKDKNNGFLLTSVPDNKSKMEKGLDTNLNLKTICNTDRMNEKEKILKISNTLKYNKNNDKKALSCDYKKLKGINLFEEKLKKLRKNNENQYNHPYYEFKTLLKKEKYKIFERSFKNEKLQNELLKTQVKSIKDYKNLHFLMKKSPKYIKININDCNSKE